MDTSSYTFTGRDAYPKIMLVIGCAFFLAGAYFCIRTMGMIRELLFEQQGPFVDGIGAALRPALMLLFLLPFLGGGLGVILTYLFTKKELHFEESALVKASFFLGIPWGYQVIPIESGDQVIILELGDEHDIYAEDEEEQPKKKRTKRKKQYKLQHIFLLRSGYCPLLLLRVARRAAAEAFVAQLQQHYPTIQSCERIHDSHLQADRDIPLALTEEEATLLSKRRRLRRRLRLLAIPLLVAGVANAWLSADDYLHPGDARDWIAVDAALLRSYKVTSGGTRSRKTTSYGHFSYSYGGKQYRPERIKLHDVECISEARRHYRLYIRTTDPVIHACAIYGEQSKLRAALISMLVVDGAILLLLASFFIRVKPSASPEQQA